MKNGFLEHIVSLISEEELGHLKNQCFVFPTKRAGVYFKHLLRKQFSTRAFWAPDVFSIEDFIMNVSGKRISDELDLILELYKSYQQIEPNISFEGFYDWAKILLSDFDEVDRYLIDAKLLFRDLQNLKDIEAVFQTEETKKAVLNFRNSIENHTKSTLISHFLETWLQVSEVYYAFKERLSQQNLSYSGMLYRQVCEDLDEEKLSIDYSKIHFVGFNALTKAEEHIFNTLILKNKAHVYWDIPTYLLESAHEEAGFFLRKYKNTWQKNSTWVCGAETVVATEVNVYGSSGAENQALTAGNLLSKYKLEQAKDALVLGDESLLQPVLFSLPGNIRTNITMGYPIMESPFTELAFLFLKLANVEKTSKGEIYLKRELLNNFLEHPFIKNILTTTKTSVNAFLKRRGHVIALSQIRSELSIEPLNQLLFTIEGKNPLEALFQFLSAIFRELKDDEELFSKEIVYHLLKQIKSFSEKVSILTLGFGLKELIKLLENSLRTVKVPFSGEPFDGIQIMGFLETRALDFENLVVLSVNEDILPSQRNYNTYLTYGLRKAFELPTFEEQDAIFAYHFKRLISRAKNIHLIYNTQLSYDGSGEMSRYIAQLDYSAKNEGIKLNYWNSNNEVIEKREPPLLKVEKNAFTAEKLKKFVEGKGTSYLSPTALLTYIENPFEFYLKHVLGVREPEIQEEDFDAREFGMIVHKALEEIYKPYKNAELTKGLISEFRKNGFIGKIVSSALISERIIQDLDDLKGKNKLFYSIICGIVDKVLEKDLSQLPFKMLDVESEELKTAILVNNQKIRVGGIVDRIDEKNEIVRIIDYKTGKVELPSATQVSKLSPEEYVELFFTEPKYKSGFQAYFYAYLYSLKYPGSSISAGVFELKKINRGVQFINNGKPIDEFGLSIFGNRLESLINEIFDVNVPFEEKK